MAIFYLSLMLAFAGIMLMFFVKNKSSKIIMIIGMVIWSILITLINIKSSEAGSIIPKILACIWGSISIVGLITYFVARKDKGKIILGKILISVSVIIGIIHMWKF